MDSGSGGGSRKVCVVTGTRAEYGLLKPVMEEINRSPSLSLQVVATGAHLLTEYGRTLDLIERNGIQVDASVPMIEGGDTRSSMAASIGTGIVRLTRVFDRLSPDIVVVLGDRYEILAAAIAAAYTGRVLVHISGGDSLGGGFDEYTRHAITKMAHLHFPSNPESADRLERMGERNIFTVGSTAMDVIGKLIPILPDRASVCRRYGFDEKRPLALVLYHPVTIGREDAMEAILRTVADSGCSTMVIYPNADPGSRKVIDEILRQAPQGSGGRAFRVERNLSQEDYFAVMKACDFMIGNSSSGIIETPYFRKPSIQVGTRQLGRPVAGNVLFTGTMPGEIRDAIGIVLHDEAFAAKVRTSVNPYGYGGASRRIVEVLEQVVIDDDLLRKKMTY